MINNYYYNESLKRFITGFANIFTGLVVKTGKDACGNISTLEVPIRYGSSDRVVAAIAASHTQNKLVTLPMMACYMTNINLTPERIHGLGSTDRRSFLEQGEVFPNDLKTIERLMPIPYNMEMELSIYASNTDQSYQILEQILVLFDYDLQLQFNDANFDWTKITKVTLNSIQNEETYPMGTEKRNIVWNLSFTMPIWLSPPAGLRRDIIKSIQVRISDGDNFNLAEVDENGNLSTFNGLLDDISIVGNETLITVDPIINISVK